MSEPVVTVAAAGRFSDPPELENVKPTAVVAGTSATITVTGKGFLNAATLVRQTAHRLHRFRIHTNLVLAAAALPFWHSRIHRRFHKLQSTGMLSASVPGARHSGPIR